MNTGISVIHGQSLYRSSPYYEQNSPSKYVSNFKNEIESYKNVFILHNQNDDKNYFVQKIQKDGLKSKNQFPSLHLNQFQNSLQDYDIKTYKNSDFINSIEQKRSNLNQVNQANQSPMQNIRELNFQSQEKNKEMKRKVKIEKLVQQYKICKKKLQDCKKQIQTLRHEKVQYEEIVYELKMENRKLQNKLEKLNAEIKQINSNFGMRKHQHLMISSVMNIKVIQKSQNQLQKSQQSVKMNDILCPKQEPSNNHDLQQILNDMRKKISHYEKQISQKQTLNNHQFYLLQKLRNEHNQLNLTQASLLEELQFVLTKNKKLKRQNEEIRNQNQERIRQIILLQEIKAKYQIQNNQLLQKVKQFQTNQIFYQEKINESTEQTKQPQSTNLMQIVDCDQIFPSSLTDNLNEICQYLDRKQKTVNLSIIKNINLQIFPQVNNPQQNDHQSNKSIVLKQRVVDYSKNLQEQLREKQSKILKLEQQLKQAHNLQDQMDKYLQHSKSKLSQLAKQLEILSIQHNSLKNKFQNLNMKQLNRTLSFIEQKKDGKISNQILSSVSLCLNDKFQL